MSLNQYNWGKQSQYNQSSSGKRNATDALPRLEHPGWRDGIDSKEKKTLPKFSHAKELVEDSLAKDERKSYKLNNLGSTDNGKYFYYNTKKISTTAE